MNVNIARDTAAALMRHLPRVRGHGRVGQLVNKGFLLCGASPTAVGDMKLGHRLMLDTRVPSHVWALYSGIYDDADISILSDFIRPGGAVIDVGANIGFYTIPLGLRVKSLGGRLVAFEPVPSNADRLTENAFLNGLGGTVEIVRAGLSNKTGTALVTLREDFQSGGAVGNAAIVIDDGKDDGFSTLPIAMKRLDDIWPEFGDLRLDVLKVDIEGHEDLFLEGAQETIARHQPIIQMEINPWFYERRGIDIGQRIKSLLPSAPSFRLTHGKLSRTDPSDIREIVNVFLIPPRHDFS
jgi:FkbM family methyltransferase